MTSRDTSKPPASAKPYISANLEEGIRRRAYELYEQRGRQDGHDVEDWLRAEELVRQTRTRSVAA